MACTVFNVDFLWGGSQEWLHYSSDVSRNLHLHNRRRHSSHIFSSTLFSQTIGVFPAQSFPQVFATTPWLRHITHSAISRMLIGREHAMSILAAEPVAGLSAVPEYLAKLSWYADHLFWWNRVDLLSLATVGLWRSTYILRSTAAEVAEFRSIVTLSQAGCVWSLNW